MLRLTEQIVKIVLSIEQKTRYHFTKEELENVYSYTLHKCKIIKEDESYIPILFENELRDYLTRKYVTQQGHKNYLRKKAMKEVSANV